MPPLLAALTNSVVQLVGLSTFQRSHHLVRFTNWLAEQNMQHRYSVYELEADQDDLVGELADYVRRLYVDVDGLGSDLTEALGGLGGIADVTHLKELVDEVLGAAIPSPGANPNQPSQLRLERNELAEILAYEVALQIHAATIPATRVREKEIPGQPARGLDLLSIVDQDPKQLLVTEVKASESPASPPAVVCVSGDSLRQQTLNILGDRDRLLQELNWAHKHCDPGDRKLVASALILAASEQIQLVVAPVLVRSSASYTRSDFGCFESEPDEFAPAQVDFVILRLPGEIEELATKVYLRAGKVE